MIALAALALPAAAAAQSPRVSIGTISSEQSCTTYVMSAGRSAVIVGQFGVAAAASWRTWLERDCVDNFATVRASLAAALASSGKIMVAPRGSRGSFVLSAVISEVGSRGSNVSGQDFRLATDHAAVSMSLTLRDPAGRVVDGRLITRTLETGSTIQTDAFASHSIQDGRTLYTQLEQGLALQATRFVAFRLRPMHVIADGPDGIRLDYGAPLLALGTMVQVQSPDGRLSRFRVVAAGNGVAEAEADDSGAPIAPGSQATVVEDDDPAVNARTMRRRDLP